MGLDIEYFRQVKHAPDAAVDEDGCPADWDTHTKIHINPDFPGRADDLIDHAVYETTDGDGFRAGSYGGYNDWREQLAKMAGYAPTGTDPRHQHSASAWAAEGGPFYELIHFSDCEGVIGAAVSAKLAKDFAEHKAAADGVGGYFAEKYGEWRKAFETAADSGFVDFH